MLLQRSKADHLSRLDLLSGPGGDVCLYRELTKAKTVQEPLNSQNTLGCFEIAASWLDMGFLPEIFLPANQGAICRQKRQIFHYVLCTVPKC